MENKNLKFCQRCENSYNYYGSDFNYWLCMDCFNILNIEHLKKMETDLLYRIHNFENCVTPAIRMVECEPFKNCLKVLEFLADRMGFR